MLATLKQPRYLGLFGIGVVVAVLCVFAGTWQVARFSQKRDANDTYRSNNRAVATAPTEVLGQPLKTSRLQALRQSAIQRDAHKYRKVSVTGTYLTGEQSLLRGQTVNNNIGYIVLTPLRTSSGVLLIARGFIDQNNAADTSPGSIPAPPSGPVSVIARLEAPDTKTDRWGQLPGVQVDTVNLADQAARAGVSLWTDYAELLPGQPGQVGLTAIPAPDMSNPAGGAEEAQHAAYVFQWYSFAILALAGPFILARAERRREHASPDSPDKQASLDDRLAGLA